jgi:hypothetical protein
MDDTSTLPVPIGAETAPARVSPIAQLAQIPEEEIWLQKQKSARTRRAYRLDVQHFMRTLGIATPEELRQADHKAVITWERFMRETEHAASSTIRRRLAALSSLYKHLVRHGFATRNPVGEVERPAINRDEGSTLVAGRGSLSRRRDQPPTCARQSGRGDMSRPETLRVSRGTDGSNPTPSSGESGANRAAAVISRRVLIAIGHRLGLSGPDLRCRQPAR